MTDTLPVGAVNKRNRGRPKGSKDSVNRKKRVLTDKSKRVLDLLHRRFGHLTVVARGPVNNGRPGGSVPALWHAVCDCGNTKLTDAKSLTRGDIKTCGQSGCPFKAALHVANFKKTQDNMVVRTAIDKVGKVGFSLSADEVRTLLKTSCKLCGHKGSGHEIRCYDHAKGYVLSNCYSVCKDCQGLVPITTGYHATWEEVLKKLLKITMYVTLSGDIKPGVDKAFHEKVEAIVEPKVDEEINIQILCV